MTKDGKDEEMIDGLTVDDRDALRDGLRGLPDTMPPRAVWHRIREQAEAEGIGARGSYIDCGLEPFAGLVPADGVTVV